MAGADDLAGLDLEVGHRVGARAVGEHQVAVELVGVGALGLGRGSARRRSRRCAPPRPAARPCRSTLRAAVRHGVVDEQPVLEVLAGVGEVEAEHLDVATGARRTAPRARPGRGRRRSDTTMLLNRASRPTVTECCAACTASSAQSLMTDDGQRGAVADEELDVVGVGRAADVVEHDDRLGERLDVDEQVPEGAPLSTPSPRSVTTVGALATASRGHRDDGGLLERRPGAGRDPVGRHAGPAEPGVVAGRPSRRRPRGRRRPRRTTLAVAGAPSSSCRCRRRCSGVNRHSSSRPVGTSKSASSNERCRSPRLSPGTGVAPCECGLPLNPPVSGLRISRSASDAQPTAPSICSSMSRLSSRAYSIGSSLAIGSTKPRTIIAIASSSVSPRLIR